MQLFWTIKIFILASGLITHKQIVFSVVQRLLHQLTMLLTAAEFMAKLSFDSLFTRTTRWIQEFHTDMCVGNNKSSQREDEYKEKLTMLSFNYKRRRQFPINTSICSDHNGQTPKTLRRAYFSHEYLYFSMSCVKQ